jgi:hypothetical protein
MCSLGDYKSNLPCQNKFYNWPDCLTDFILSTGVNDEIIIYNIHENLSINFKMERVPFSGFHVWYVHVKNTFYTGCADAYLHCSAVTHITTN